RRFSWSKTHLPGASPVCQANYPTPANRLERAQCLLNLVLTFVAGGAPAIAAWLTKLTIDALTLRDAGAYNQAIWNAFGLLAVGITTAVIPHCTTYCQTRLRRSLALYSQEHLFTSVNRFQGIARFEDPDFLDHLRLAQQSGSTAPSQVVNCTFRILQAAVSTVGFVAALITVSPVVSILALIAAVPSLAAQLDASRRRANYLWRSSPVQRRQVFYRSLLTEEQAVKEVRIFGLGSFLRDRMLKELKVMSEGEEAVDRRVFIVQTPMALAAAAISGCALVWAVIMVSKNRLTVGDLAVFIAGIAGLQAAVGGIVGSTADLVTASLSFEHYRIVVDAPPDLALPDRPKSVGPLRQCIEFRNVWFRYYDDAPWILQGVNLTIHRGEAMALVGLNGAGKSTLVKLLCRLYDPVEGSISWDGLDIRTLQIEELRARMGAIFQDYMAYDLTAYENIAIGDLKRLSDKNAVVKAARAADAHDVLKGLPHGYDTLLSRTFFVGADNNDPTLGVVLSGGQWQRVAFARGLMRAGVDLMVLDEPTAGLDADAEAGVHARIEEHRTAITSLLISHRMGAVRKADRIAVLSDGVIAELGTHEELLAENGHYARLFNRQAADFQESSTNG
ncbi:ABC transporter ATP-binding protein, partial [Streptomyces sp. NPDC017405]|uniref:ABC transporter ATP-binding protein n=1 Tax=unclassified Streptomyces TaxID=2593676 RepID=UPI003796E72E